MSGCFITVTEMKLGPILSAHNGAWHRINTQQDKGSHYKNIDM